MNVSVLLILSVETKHYSKLAHLILQEGWLVNKKIIKNMKKYYLWIYKICSFSINGMDWPWVVSLGNLKQVTTHLCKQLGCRCGRKGGGTALQVLMNRKQSLFCHHSNLLSTDMSAGQTSAAFIIETLICNRIRRWETRWMSLQGTFLGWGTFFPKNSIADYFSPACLSFIMKEKLILT